MQTDPTEFQGTVDGLLELVVVSQAESRRYACTDEVIPKFAEIDCGKLATVPPGDRTGRVQTETDYFD
jgi:hypothetical protein